MEFRSSQPAR